MIDVRQGYENCREAIGWDHDIMVHCHWEYDLRTAIQIAEAIEPIKPMWFEDPLQVEYSEVWTALRAASHVPICTGENLARRQGFKDFIIHQGCDILHPDLRNSGGFLETKRIADMASVYGLPMSTHNTGSQLHTWATCQWAASIRDFLAVETITGQGGWMDQLLVLDGPYIKTGCVQVTDKPGLGVEINPDVARRIWLPGRRGGESNFIAGRGDFGRLGDEQTTKNDRLFHKKRVVQRRGEASRRNQDRDESDHLQIAYAVGSGNWRMTHMRTTRILLLVVLAGALATAQNAG